MSEEKEPVKGITPEEQVVINNQKELARQINAHFNGTPKEQKTALRNIDKTFENLTEAAKKIKED